MILRLSENAIRGFAGFAGLNMTELAEKVGVARPTIYNLMAGNNTDLDTVARVADALGVHPFDIMLATGFPPQRNVYQDAILARAGFGDNNG